MSIICGEISNFKLSPALEQVPHVFCYWLGYFTVLAGCPFCLREHRLAVAKLLWYQKMPNCSVPALFSFI